ncbi:MAG: hypothetical protein M5U28_13665 [Sandaracinaceae bacterium]|nr:hypothetical protein [Sandaracinaceae bacterium]
MRAGQTLSVSCVLIDAMGEAFAAPADLVPSLRFVPATSVERAEDGTWFATRAGEVEVACAFDALRMTDDTPSIVEVLPGDPARAVAHVDPDSMPAGAETVVSCDVYDAWGNRVEDASPSLRAEPSDGSNTFDGHYGQFLHAGRFEVFCDLAGAEAQGALLEVYPNVPASLLISRVPDQPVYGIGQTIEIQRLVHDRFGNLITDVEVPTVSDPPGQSLGDGRYRYLADGLYTVTATVTPPTEGDIPLVASTDILVDGSGPAIGCDDPIDGGILDVTPGTRITFRGSVSDLTGVRTVRVNGSPIAISADGTFLTPLVTRYGINFVDLAAVDGSGREASRTCAFLVADTWAPDDRTLSDTLSLRLRQEAFDDSNRSDGLDSLADVLHTVLNSRGLRDQLHAALLAANPLKPSSCDQGGPFGTCLLRSEVIYLDSVIGGPNRVTPHPRGRGPPRHGARGEPARARAHPRPRRGHRVRHDRVGHVQLGRRRRDLQHLAGQRQASRDGPLRLGHRLGQEHLHRLLGLDGAIVDIAVSLFNGSIRTLVRNTIRDYVTNNFDDILDGVLGSLDIDSLGTSFLVRGSTPRRPSASRSTSASRASAPPRAACSSAWARASTRRPRTRGPRWAPRSSAARAGSTRAAPDRPRWRCTRPCSSRRCTRSGAAASSTRRSARPPSAESLPAGVEATMVTGLPPVVVLRADKRVELSIGAVTLLLRYPDLFAEPITRHPRRARLARGGPRRRGLRVLRSAHRGALLLDGPDQPRHGHARHHRGLPHAPLAARALQRARRRAAVHPHPELHPPLLAVGLRPARGRVARHRGARPRHRGAALRAAQELRGPVTTMQTLVRARAIALLLMLLPIVAAGCGGETPSRPPSRARIDPSRLWYHTGQVVTLTGVVTDFAGENIEDVSVLWTAEPPARPRRTRLRPILGRRASRWARRAPSSSPAAWSPPTRRSGRRSATASTCASTTACRASEVEAPVPGAELDDPDGIVVRGSVADRSVVRVYVNGQLAPTDDLGRFEATVPAEFGVNHLLVDASDGLTDPSQVQMDVLWAPAYTPALSADGRPELALDDGLALRLGQPFFDDGLRSIRRPRRSGRATSRICSSSSSATSTSAR